MSITDELREYARGWGWLDADNADEIEVLLEDFANRIDREHKAAVDKAHADGERNGLQQARSASEDYRRGYEAGKADSFDEGFAGADDWLARALEMAEHGWVKLPVDADGVPIRIGDVLECRDGRKGYYACLPAKVVGYHECCGEVCPIVENDGEYQVMPEMVCHDHTQTVEDVLLEACKAYHALLIEGLSDVAHDMPAPSEIIAEYAAKLRLADDGKEQQ